jgi:hypothetical protein
VKQSALSTIELYSETARESVRLLRRHWRIVPASLGLVMLWIFSFSLLGSFFSLLAGLSLIGSLILGLLQAAIIGMFYNWVADIASNRTPDWRTFRYETFSSVIAFGFFFYLIELSAQALGGSREGFNLVTLFIHLVVVIWCNPAPEIIQHIQPDGVNGIMLCYEFMKEQGAAWLGAIVLVVSPLLFISGTDGLFTVMRAMNPLFPVAALALPGSEVSSAVFGQIFGGMLGSIGTLFVSLVLGIWIMIFRSILFQRLSGRR